MFIRIGRKILNTDHIVEVEVKPKTEDCLLCASITISEHLLHLHGEEAELFLTALPVYEPVMETDGES